MSVFFGAVLRREEVMAERITARAKRHEAPKDGPKRPRKSATKAASGKVVQSTPPAAVADKATDAELANENQQLRAELAAARERIADLESKQTDITNRIAWVIDSLHNLDE